MKKKSTTVKKSGSKASASNKKATLYTYVKPVNREFAIQEAKRLNIKGGYSQYVDMLLTQQRG